MTNYISILRGINVGAHRRIKMDALRQLFIDLGFTNVQTYIQSGNVIFSSNESKTEALADQIALKIKEVAGFEVQVFVFTQTEITAALDKTPYCSDISKNPNSVHITFLSQLPNQTTLEKLSASNYSPDEFICIDKCVYLYCPNGYGNTKLTNTFFENKLKLTATTRNLKTCKELADLVKNQPPKK